MEISNSLQAAGAQRAQPQEPVRQAAAQPVGGDGRDKENDGDRDDGAVTASRGQNVNIKA